MPLTLTATEGVFKNGTEKQVFQRLSAAMLKWHGLAGNEVMTPNVVGSIQILPKESTYSGHQESTVVFVEWKVPSFAFASREIQKGYIEEATQIVLEMSQGHPKERVWVNVVHAVDGAWGIGGEALTNQELGAALSKK